MCLRQSQSCDDRLSKALHLTTILLCSIAAGALCIIGLSHIIGGGIGNLIDRIFNSGAVIDFMNIGINDLRTGIFNIADVAITAGIVMLIFASSG